MNDQSNDLKKWWLFLPLLLAPLLGLRAQCEGPFNLACIGEINLNLSEDCTGLVTYDMVITGAPACLGADNFEVLVEDGIDDNGAAVAGPGRFRYTVVGKNHPELTGFNCWGYVTVADLTPPVIAPFADDPVDLGCGDRTASDVNALPAEISNCYRVNGATGAVIPGTLAPALRAILTRNTPLPLITDACAGEVEVCVNDIFDTPVGSLCFDTVSMERTFTATQLPENPDLAPAVRAQHFRFFRPALADLVGVPETRFISCERFERNDPNPSPRAEDYPFFPSPSGPIFVNAAFCNFNIIVSDGNRIEGCGDNFTFLRTFEVIDWCEEVDTSFVQFVRVGDMAAPVITPPTQDNDFDGIPDVGPLRFPSNTANCAGYVNTRTGGIAVTDACSPSVQLLAYVFLDGRLENFPLGPYPVFSDNIMDALTGPIPVGAHLLRYIAQDACNNASSVDVHFEIYDAIEPLMVCEDGLNVNLDGSGLAVLHASIFDAGSQDDCSPLQLQVALADDSDAPLTGFGDQVFFSCENLGETRIILRGTDAAGNVNNCWLDILVEDKTYPTCVPPPDVSLTCTAFETEFSQDLAWDFAADPFGVSVLLDEAFGTMTGVDNCPGTRSLQSINGELNNCGVGQFTRFFRVVDASGLLANNECRQIINVTAHHDYSIRFPGDERYLCGELPMPEDIIGQESGCDLLVVTTDVDTLTVADAGDCYKLRLTHDVINWCEYNSIAPPILVPRDPDGDGNFSEPIYVNVTGVSSTTLDDDRAILDQDATPFNGNDFGPLVTNFGTSTRRGFYRYQQFIRVYDNVDPSLNVASPDPGLAFTEDCRGGVLLEFTATDNCSGETTTTVSVDTDVIDRNNDGVFTGIDFRVDREISPNFFSGDPVAGVEVRIRNLPIGRHLARVRTTDNCGNQDQRFVILTVEDGKAPTPICIRSLSMPLTPDPDLGGLGVIWATDYVASPATVCTDSEITYAIYRETEAAEPGFLPDPNHNRLDVDCGDLGEVLVRIYAFATSNNRYDFCNAVLHVTDNNGNVCEDFNGSLTGLIRTETGVPLEDITVFNDGPVSLEDVTDEEGTFHFDGLEELRDYTIQPYENRNSISGVSTRDITMIARYLLGVDDNLTPYQLIAADANRNREITVRDLLTIREVILGIKDGFDNNTSWRFIPSDYSFPDLDDPFLEVFPEVGNFNNLTGSHFIEFVAVKVGDLDNSANGPQGAPAPGNGVENPQTNENGVVNLEWRPDGTELGDYGLFLASDRAPAGFQFSLDLPAKTAVRPGLIEAEAYHLAAGARLHVSYASQQVAAIYQEEALLTIHLPNTTTPLPTLVGTDPQKRFLQPEAYGQTLETLPLSINIAADTPPVVTASVYPNPMRERATLSLNWPVAENATLAIHDASGRLLQQRGLRLNAGNNQVGLSADALENGDGIYFLRVTGETGERKSRVLRLLRSK